MALKTTIPFFLHDLGQPEVDAVAEVLKGPILTTGETVRHFEQRFAEYLGCRHAVGVTSCTGALHLSLLALGIGEGDEVITTPMTFVATATAILQAGATPVFVDVEPSTGNLDTSRIEAALTERTRAILPVHLYGQMCDMRAIRRIADRFGLYVVEDAAHCIEGMRDGVRPGQLADAACFSFYATKNMTCGEGGAVVTNDATLARRLRLMRLHGVTKTAADRHREGYRHWDMILMGWKYNMDNVQAALLLPQLARIEANLAKRERLAQRYMELLAEIPAVSWPETLPGVRHARHLFPVFVDRARRDAVIRGLHVRGIEAMVHYRPIHLLTYFRKSFGLKRGDFPNAECLGERVVSLPFYPNMKEEQVDRVVEALRHVLQSRKPFGCASPERQTG